MLELVCDSEHAALTMVSQSKVSSERKCFGARLEASSSVGKGTVNLRSEFSLHKFLK